MEEINNCQQDKNTGYLYPGVDYQSKQPLFVEIRENMNDENNELIIFGSEYNQNKLCKIYYTKTILGNINSTLYLCELSRQHFGIIPLSLQNDFEVFIY